MSEGGVPIIALVLQVASVDLSIRPVSYGIYLNGSDNLRETESPRLRPRDQIQQPASQGASQGATSSVSDVQKANSDQAQPQTEALPHRQQALQPTNSRLKKWKLQTIRAMIGVQLAGQALPILGSLFI